MNIWIASGSVTPLVVQRRRLAREPTPPSPPQLPQLAAGGLARDVPCARANEDATSTPVLGR
ncbi:MAG: hypothetical protein ABIZ91_20295 [Gemmatimonadaceae bacterium]